ncbi:unnamed protein product [Danaus chrysippus]|uniref:non-specific serine/threonine protein kinase n=1 Tax=Danaus chrysippus TaxID=151541 RepID=A0A8J2QUS9_9NEOP|nr:unnamed protein product [Danaus chrysippus]
MNDNLKILKQGAEAKLYICNYLGKPTLIKERFRKHYRHPDLDTSITKERIKNEARSIVRCKSAGIKTPSLYLVDFERRRIYMQHFERSITVKDFLIYYKKVNHSAGDNNSLDSLVKSIGETVRKLHDNNIIHGDLTTSNMLLIEKEPSDVEDDTRWLNNKNIELVLIDFGLSFIDSSSEDKGVDLYVLERALLSTHNDYHNLFEKILTAYKCYSKSNIKEVISKFEDVRARGRKRTMGTVGTRCVHIVKSTVVSAKRDLRGCLSSQEAIERRHHLFMLEKKRQLDNVGRIEKIEVKYIGVPKDCTLVMNKDISTPYECARHFTEWHMESSALALVDGSVHWDMHRPLTGNCTLEFQRFNIAEPQQVNKAFWRTCSLVLGACATVAFKDSVPVHLHSFPGPDIRSGSFIYDIDLPSLPDWKPTPQELYTLSAEYVQLCRKKINLERLDVSEELALEMFVDNEHKAKQIPSIARNNGKVTLYKVDKHIDISKGPMISNTGQIGKVTITSVHKLTGVGDPPQLYRFQGVALPTGVILNHFAFSILTDRAKKLNPARSPISPVNEDHSQDKAAARV